MDRSDNPGMVERELDETPMEGSDVERGTSGGPMDRDSMQGGGRSVEREGMQGGGGTERESVHEGQVEREGMQGAGLHRDERENVDRQSLSGSSGAVNDTMMRADQREGGYGFDRPADLAPQRDMDSPARGVWSSREDDGGMRGSSRDGGDRDMGTDTRRGSGDVNNMGRDW